MRYNVNLKIEDLFPERSDGLCRRCQTKLTGKQKKWCSKDCSLKAFDEMMIAKGSSTYIRKAVFKRDKGVCAECKIDTGQIDRIHRHAQNAVLKTIEVDWSERNELTQMVSKLFQESGAMTFAESYSVKYIYPVRPMWQADHIIEIANGGSHSLDNLQTLCISCHKTKTREFHRLRKIQRDEIYPLSEYENTQPDLF